MGARNDSRQWPGNENPTRTARSRHHPRDAVPPRVVKLREAGGELACKRFDPECVAAHGTDPRDANAELPSFSENLLRIVSRGGKDDAALGFAKEQRIEAGGFCAAQVHICPPEPPGFGG